MTTTSEKTWLAVVLDADDEHEKPDTAYRFTGGRTFECSDSGSSGVYE